MSKNRKPHESPVGAPPRVPPPGNSNQPAGRVLARGVLVQLLAIGGLSCVLGFTFNAASPVGVRFDAPSAPPIPTKANLVEATPAPSTLLPPVKTNLIVAPPLPPAPVKTAATAPQPTPPVTKPVTAPTPWSVTPTQANANPVVVATPPPVAQTNPAAIHWPEAKVLAAAGRAVLVDVRHKGSYDAGHIPGAISLPETSPPADFTTFLSRQPPSLTVIVYCASTSCSQSARVANRLVNEFHWPAVRYMTGGYAEYQQAELAKPAPQPVP